MEILGPERPGSQGLDPQQYESGNRAILGLLEDPEVSGHVDLVITYRDGAYEAWAGRGMVRFRRVLDSGRVRYETVEQHGQDPLASQDPTLLATLEEELRISGSNDPNRCFFEPEQVSYPFAHERIAQLFDSPFAPDLVVSPRAYAFGIQVGQHGALDVVQSRAPLAFAGPGIRPGRHPKACRQVDVAPTVCHLMGFPTIKGKNAIGRSAPTYLMRQDGEVLDSVLAPEPDRPKRAYIIVLDGVSHTELLYRFDHERDSIPNIRSILSRAAIFQFGSIVNFPSITWPSHSALVTGAWCGHHDIVNPTYYLRDRRESVSPQGQLMNSEGFLGDGVETLYEAFRRARGSFTAAIHEPQGRGADHAPLESRVVGDGARLKALTPAFIDEIHPKWVEVGNEIYRDAVFDARGLAQIAVLFDDGDHPAPELVIHELSLPDAVGHDWGPHSAELRLAVDETDRRVGHILQTLDKQGLLEETLFVVASDHGMACQDVSLSANPAWHPERKGMKTVTSEPMIWLRDLRVEIHRAPDGRTARVEVAELDSTPSGELPSVEGAEVEAVDRSDRRIAEGHTDGDGRFAFGTPADIPSDQIVVAVRHPEFNARHLTLAGDPFGPDPRRFYR